MIMEIQEFAFGVIERKDAMTTGKPIPNFALANQEGKIVRLDDFSGQTLILFAYPRAATSG